MPELPEVESVRRTLLEALPDRVVVRVTVHTRTMVALPGDPLAGFSRSRSKPRPVRMNSSLLLQGDRIRAIDRHGKQLALVGSSEKVVCVHLGMTGSLRAGEDRRAPHTHVRWILNDGSHLCFIDPRRFGLIASHPTRQDLLEKRWNRLGPDALNIDAKALEQICCGRQRCIKSVLLDQSLIAGIGNIYADESLFRAGIRPSTPAGTIDRTRLAALARAVRTVLRQAIRAKGSTIRDYRDSDGQPGAFQKQHKVYGRADSPCRTCGFKLVSATIAQRTTVFCPKCQAE